MHRDEHLELIERDRLDLLARLEFELTVDVSPAPLWAQLPVVPHPLKLAEREAEVLRRVERARRKTMWYATNNRSRREFRRYAAEQAKIRRDRSLARLAVAA